MPPRFADLLGFMGSGSPELEASLTLGHCIIPFLCTLVVQIGTMQCFYCPQKDVSLVPWDSLSSADQALLRDKYPDAGEGAVCEFCVRSARPSAFFSRHSHCGLSLLEKSLCICFCVPLFSLCICGLGAVPKECALVVVHFFVIFLGDPGQKRAWISKMSLYQFTPLGYSGSAQSSRAHAKKSATN